MLNDHYNNIDIRTEDAANDFTTPECHQTEDHNNRLDMKGTDGHVPNDEKTAAKVIILDFYL